MLYLQKILDIELILNPTSDQLLYRRWLYWALECRRNPIFNLRQILHYICTHVHGCHLSWLSTLLIKIRLTLRKLSIVHYFNQCRSVFEYVTSSRKVRLMWSLIRPWKLYFVLMQKTSTLSHISTSLIHEDNVTCLEFTSMPKKPPLY